MVSSSTKHGESTSQTPTPTTPPHNATSSHNSRPQYRTPPKAAQSKNNDNNPPSPLPLSHPHLEIPVHYSHNNEDENEPISQTSFSPSKARAQAKATHELGQLKNWLSNLLLSTPESSSAKLDQTTRQSRENLLSRWEVELQQQNSSDNNSLASEITKALQELMLTNRTADAYRELVHEAEKEELGLLRSRARNVNQNRDQHAADGPDEAFSSRTKHLLYELEARLSPGAKESLSSLAETAVLLGVIPSPCSSSSSSSLDSIALIDELAVPIMEQTKSAFELSDNIQRLTSLNATLNKQLDQAESRLQSLQEEKTSSERKTESLQAQTSQWQRETKQILLKIQEYNDRIATLNRTRPGSEANPAVLIEDIAALKEQVVERRTAVRQLEDRVKAFGGLPADLEASREEVKRARIELHTLKQRREEMFENIVG